jgi:NTP pyrophosphatase (non-canonical NTP hydrolase)
MISRQLLDDIEVEQTAADDYHGARSVSNLAADDPTLATILIEEVGEVAREFNEAALARRGVDLDRLRDELVQVASISLGWLAIIDGDT